MRSRPTSSSTSISTRCSRSRGSRPDAGAARAAGAADRAARRLSAARCSSSSGHPVIWMGRSSRCSSGGSTIRDDLPHERRGAGILMLADRCSSSRWRSPSLIRWVAAAHSLRLGHRGDPRDDAARAEGARPRRARRRRRPRPLARRRAAGPSATSSAAIPRRSTSPASPAPRSRASPKSTSDGVVAPLFWLLIFGLPGIALYKAINTADSMVGHLDRALPRVRLGQRKARRRRQLDPGAADRAAHRGRRVLRQRRRPRGGVDARRCATRRSTLRPMPAGPRRPWPGRSASRSAARAATTAKVARSAGVRRRPDRPRRQGHPPRAGALRRDADDRVCWSRVVVALAASGGSPRPDARRRRVVSLQRSAAATPLSVIGRPAATK